MMKIKSNNLFLLKEIFKVCWYRVVFSILQRILKKFATAFLIQIFLFKYIIDSIETNKSFNEIVYVVTGVIIVVLLCFVFIEWYNNICVPLTDIILKKHFKVKIYEKAYKVDLACYDDANFYSQYTKTVNDIEELVNNTLNGFTEIFAQIAALIGLFAIFLVLDPFLVIISIIPVIFSYLLNVTRNKYNFARYNDSIPIKRQEDYIGKVFYEKQYAKELRLTNVSSLIFNKYNRLLLEYRILYKKYGVKGWLLGIWENINVFGIVTYGSYIYLIYQIVLTKNLSIGDFAAMFNAVRVVDVELRLVISQISKMQENSLHIDNYKQFMNYKNKVCNSTKSLLPFKKNKNAISIENLSFGYSIDKMVLRNINMNINCGEKIALVGHNGAGKTTLIKLILRLYDPNSGNIYMNNQDLRDYNLDEYRNKFSTVFQDFTLFAITLKENIKMNDDNIEDEIITNALQWSGFNENIRLDSMITKEFDNNGYIPSGGLAQKIALARAYFSKKDIMILDEPTSSLDPISEYEFNKKIINLAQDKTVIFISHRLSTTVDADKIYYFENGIIIESGSHDQLMKLNNKYAKMFNMQAENYRKGINL